MTTPPVRIAYFTDLLCVWAYVAQIKVDELKRHFQDRIELDYHFLTLFGNTHTRLVEGWRERGGIEAYGRHVQHIGRDFPHVEIHPQVWQHNRPYSSMGCHLFLKAVSLLEQDGLISPEPRPEWAGRSLFEETIWRLRQAFFRDLQDIGRLDCQRAIAAQLDLPWEAIRERLENGAACAAFHTDLEIRERYGVRGSPTFILNEGRQILYGNVGYKIIEANIHELLERPQDQASWC